MSAVAVAPRRWAARAAVAMLGVLLMVAGGLQLASSAHAGDGASTERCVAGSSGAGVPESEGRSTLSQSGESSSETDLASAGGGGTPRAGAGTFIFLFVSVFAKRRKAKRVLI